MAGLRHTLPVATFSIVARDPATGELGIAVASKFIAVGSVVPWAKAGIGAIATQAWANTTFGLRGLGLLEARQSPAQALDHLLATDARSDHRQVAILDAHGRAAAHTGNACLPFAAHHIGENYCVQGNILTGEAVLNAMGQAFGESDGELSDRMLAALSAGQAAGGDARGRQSAALLVVREGWGYAGQSDRYRDLRVDDHENPVVELQRIHQLHRTIFPPPHLMP